MYGFLAPSLWIKGWPRDYYHYYYFYYCVILLDILLDSACKILLILIYMKIRFYKKIIQTDKGKSGESQFSACFKKGGGV